MHPCVRQAHLRRSRCRSRWAHATRPGASCVPGQRAAVALGPAAGHHPAAGARLWCCWAPPSQLPRRLGPGVETGALLVQPGRLHLPPPRSQLRMWVPARRPPLSAAGPAADGPAEAPALQQRRRSRCLSRAAARPSPPRSRRAGSGRLRSRQRGGRGPPPATAAAASSPADAEPAVIRSSSLCSCRPWASSPAPRRCA